MFDNVLSFIRFLRKLCCIYLVVDVGIAQAVAVDIFRLHLRLLWRHRNLIFIDEWYIARKAHVVYEFVVDTGNFGPHIVSRGLVAA